MTAVNTTRRSRWTRWLAVLWLAASLSPYFHLVAMARDVGVVSEICSSTPRADGQRRVALAGDVRTAEGDGDADGDSDAAHASGCAGCPCAAFAPAPEPLECRHVSAGGKSPASLPGSQVALRSGTPWKPSLAQPPPTSARC